MKLYRTEVLDLLESKKPSIIINKSESSLSLHLIVDGFGDPIVIGTINAVRHKKTKNFEVTSIAAYPGIGKAMYAFAMMSGKDMGIKLMSDREGSTHWRAISIWDDLSKHKDVSKIPCDLKNMTEDIYEMVCDFEIEANNLDEEEYDDICRSESRKTLIGHPISYAYSCDKDERFAKYVCNGKDRLLDIDELNKISSDAMNFFSSAHSNRDDITPSDVHSAFHDIYLLVSKAKDSQSVSIEMPFDKFGEIDYEASDTEEKLARSQNIGITSDRELHIESIKK